MLNKIFPILDHLYIYQILEYESIPFLNWYIKNPFKRNLQRKHKLELTSKAQLILLISVFLSLLDTFILLSLFNNLNNPFIYILIFIFTFLIKINLFSPIFLTISQILLLPLDLYTKNKILTNASKRLTEIPNLKVVAIVGSFAKTSTKEILYTLLWKKFRVVKTPKSYNTLLSVGRSILEDLKDNTEVFIVEMDAYHSGEIDMLAKLVKPQIGVITGIAAQHLGRFGSMDNLAHTQFEILDNLPLGGVLFLNSSDQWSMKIKDEVRDKKTKVKQFGFQNEDDLYAADIKNTDSGVNFTLHYKKSQTSISLPLLGEHHISNFLASASLALDLGLSLEEISKRSSKILPTPHRLEIKKQGQITIIDNSYNTNPTVSQSSLKLLENFGSEQKILITPGLVELGNQSEVENINFAKAASQVCDHIIIVGENAKEELLKGLKEADYPQNKTHLVKNLTEGFTLLAKLADLETVVLLENDLPDQYF